MNRKHSLLILGCGYVGEKLANACIRQGMEVTGTTRNPERAAALERVGIHPLVVESPLLVHDEVLDACDAVLDSIPLVRDEHGMRAGQPVWLPRLAPKLSHIRWAGYLSTTGVYGDADGAWVDESYACHPGSPRGTERLRAEQAWMTSDLPAEVFRVAGIYGPERNIIARLMAGNYKAVKWNPPHYASRIHVDDIVAALVAAMLHPRAERIVNLADDLPWPHDEYVQEVAAMIGAPRPVILSPEEGAAQLSPLALDFFRDNKRVSNRLLHAELLPKLQYPDFRAAMQEVKVSALADIGS
ncbi:MAG TPA: SDR family oxidoreductase [Mariprofundaceae bacterium]|nr:SDR family oxidoreductase [Mariprofundaceae bacterium]